MSKKAERIYRDTKSVISGYIRKGNHFDCMNHVHCNDHEIIYMGTVNDLMKLVKLDIARLERESRRYQRDPESVERNPFLFEMFQQDVEVIRRTYLTINNHKRELENFRRFVKGEITFDEYMENI